jgi:membrane protease YdiL (CAAX protease family)
MNYDETGSAVIVNNEVHHDDGIESNESEQIREKKLFRYSLKSVLFSLFIIALSALTLMYSSGRKVVSPESSEVKFNIQKNDGFTTLSEVPLEIDDKVYYVNMVNSLTVMLFFFSLGCILVLYYSIKNMIYPDLLWEKSDTGPPECAWGFLDLITLLAVVVLVSSLPGALLRFFGKVDYLGLDQSIYRFIGAEFVGVFFFILLVRYRTGSNEVLGLSFKGFFENIFAGVRKLLTFIPVYAIIVTINIVIFFFLIRIAEYKPDPDTQMTVMGSARNNTFFAYFLGFMAVVAAPFIEEIAFRGILYGWLRKFFSVWGSALMCGLIFGAAHGHAIKIIPISAVGVLFCFLRERTGSLIAPMVAHGVYNGILVASIVAAIV